MKITTLGYLALLVATLSATVSGCTTASSAAAQTPGRCTVDADCVLVDVCGCECRAELGRTPPPMACSESCRGTPCAGHRAVCEAGTCVVR